MFEHSRDTFYVSDGISFSNLRFENDVEMYGAQARYAFIDYKTKFENDVEMYGAQAFFGSCKNDQPFENDVEMYGAQARTKRKFVDYSLRMM